MSTFDRRFQMRILGNDVKLLCESVKERGGEVDDNILKPCRCLLIIFLSMFSSQCLRILHILQLLQRHYSTNGGFPGRRGNLVGSCT